MRKDRMKRLLEECEMATRHVCSANCCMYPCRFHRCTTTCFSRVHHVCSSVCCVSTCRFHVCSSLCYCFRCRCADCEQDRSKKPLRASSPEKPNKTSNKDGTDLNFEGGRLADFKDKAKSDEFEIVGENELKTANLEEKEPINSDLGKEQTS